MKFKITRTSIHDDNKKPYENAIRENGKWIIEVEKIEDIFRFNDSVIVTAPNEFNGFTPQLEIYDSWRE